MRWEFRAAPLFAALALSAIEFGRTEDRAAILPVPCVTEKSDPGGERLKCPPTHCR